MRTINQVWGQVENQVRGQVWDQESGLGSGS